jgi:hypothetical protein
MVKKPSRWVRFFGTAALFTGSLLMTAVLMEFAIRIVAPQQLIMTRPDIWVPRDSLGWTFRPSLNTEVNTGERTVRLVTDSFGYRVSSMPRTPGVKRVLLLGDSFMAALQVEYEQTFAGLLEARLTELLGTPVEVWNTGVPAWDAPQYRTLAVKVLPQHHFDAVVAATFLGNDVVERDNARIRPVQLVERHEFSWPRSLSWTGIVDAWLSPLNDRLESSSHAFVFAKRRSEVLLMRLGLTGHAVQTTFLRDKTPSKRWDITADIFAQIRDAADRSGTPLLFVFVPSVYQVDEGVLARHAAGFGIPIEDVDVDQPNRLMAAALQSRHMKIVDPLPEFRAASRRGEVLYGRVDPHLNADGHALLARVATPMVAAMLKADSITAHK